MAAEILFFEPQEARLIPSRLREAREAKGMSMTELADAIGVTPSSVSQYEGDTKQPEWQTLAKIANKLEQPMSYFTTERPPGGEVHATAFFRSFKSRKKCVHRTLRVWSVWSAQVVNYLAHFINLPPVIVPEPVDKPEYSEDDIEKMATACRRLWKLSDGPISNMVALLESNGFVVVRAEFGHDDVDAFSCWQDGRPFIFLGNDKGCAVRFDAAHELGHMLLHRHLTQEQLEDPSVLDRIESEADRFASAFLLPAKTFIAEVFSSSLRQFEELKRRWRVSIAAMIHRCKDLGVFDERQYVNLRKQISFHRWNKREPLDDTIPVEQPGLFRNAIKLSIEAGVKTATDFLTDIKLSVNTMAQICCCEASIWEPNESKKAHLPIGLKQA